MCNVPEKMLLSKTRSIFNSSSTTRSSTYFSIFVASVVSFGVVHHTMASPPLVNNFHADQDTVKGQKIENASPNFVILLMDDVSNKYGPWD